MADTVIKALLLLLLLLIAGRVDAFPLSSSSVGYIRVFQEDGTWWFRDGSGRTFFSVGVNCAGGCYGQAEAMPLAPSRKHWIVSLLKEWGFNTVAAWSSPSVWDQLYVADRIYTDFIPNAHDVFDESFWNGPFAQRIRSEVTPFLGKTNFIGYFLDNEPEWDAQQMFAFYMSLAKDTPGSLAFVRYLTQHYRGSIRTLNRAWGTSYASFAQIPQTRPPKRYPVSMQHGILKRWRTEVAATYYRRYAALVRALDPDHLILGIRYRGIPDRELFTALAPYFDVNSINDYNRYGTLKPVYADLYRATGKPLMITEFSFSGFPHPGHKSALFVDVYRQEHRGMGYRKFVLQAARAPFMVGMHWFMWMDYPQQEVTQDAYPYPPDANVGLVSPDETVVYEELGRWVGRTNAEVETSHHTAHGVSRPKTAPQRLGLKRFVPTVDGNIAEWPKARALKPAILTSLLEDVQAHHTFFLNGPTKS